MRKLFLHILTISLNIGVFAQIPTSFDLRDHDGNNFVSTVKSQQGGTCWTHGTMASIESNLLITNIWTDNGETGEPNLAEYHLDWWNGFNKHNNDDTGGSNSTDLDVHMGGDYLVATAYFSRLEGAVRDIDGQSYDTPPNRYSDTYHYYYPRDVEWFTIDDALNGIDSIKSQLMQHGAIATCICWDNSFIDYNTNFYQPPSSTLLPNHSVTIIGWDNNRLVPAAPQNGAWLVKNSWGSTWGFDGYFWVSYYDKWSCREPEMGAVSFINIEPLQYSSVYFHDYHGWRDTKEDITEIYNAFEANENTFLTSVSFFTATDSVKYKVKIYGNNQGDSLSFALSMQEDSIVKKGFHTIDLDLPVELHDKDNFFVYLCLSDGGQPYDRTSDIPVLLYDTIIKQQTRTVVASTASEKESFYFKNNEWKDFYYYDDPSGFDNTGNFCVKGLAKDYVPTDFGAIFHIIDKETKLGIQNANVTFDDNEQFSDKQGDVQYLDFQANTSDINLSVSRNGYLDFDTLISITDSSVIIDIKLTSFVKINEIESELYFYPNPADNFIKIYGLNNTFNYKIINIEGRILKAGISDETINISSLEKGFYLIEISTENQKQILKLIKE